MERNQATDEDLLSETRKDKLKPFEESTFRQILKRCGDETLQKNQYVRFIVYHTKEGRLIGRLYEDVGGYLGTLARDHVRLLFICVEQERHGEGIGDILMKDLIKRAKAVGAKRISLRTNSSGAFFERYGARVIGLHGKDFEMEIPLR